ncbi:MAG: T9SS type A sorting domain-containing protein, partial [Candidatus Electryoneaceae bacterium]|nr:T9SS type A sorting domain-containing protein [Candidatus Electryoneaceae bacterium]
YNFVGVYDISEALSAGGYQPGNTPSAFQLLTNYPNPFNDQTTITFNLHTPGEVNLGLFDITGRKVKDFYFNTPFTFGKHSTTLDASGIPAGCYMLRFESGSQTQTKPIVILK